MPNGKKTFSDADVIRIWCNHLTVKEKVICLFVFVFLLPELITEAALGAQSTFLLRLFRLLKRITLFRFVSQLIFSVIATVLPNNVVNVLKRCYTKELP